MLVNLPDWAVIVMCREERGCYLMVGEGSGLMAKAVTEYQLQGY